MIKNKFYYGWVIVAISFIMLLMTSGIVMSFGVFMKSLVEEFSWDRTAVSLAVATFMIVQGILSPMVGRFIDRYGPRKVIAIGVLVLGLTMVLFSYVNSYPSFFITFGILAAVGYSTTTLMTNSVLVSKWFTEKKGLALGISTTGFPLGPLVFAPLIGYFIFRFDWRVTVFGLGLLLLLLLMPLVIIFVKEKDAPKSSETAGKDQVKEIITFKKLLGNNHYLKLAGAYFGCGFTMALVSTHFPIHAIGLGLTDLVAATAFGLMGGFAVFGTISAGALSDKYGRKNLLAAVYFTRCLALSTFVFATNPTMLYIGAVIFGISWTATGPLTTAITGDIWGTKVMGTVFGYIFLFHQFGAAAGAYLGGIVFDYSNSYQMAFLLGALILLISAVSSYFIDESKGKQNAIPLLVERGAN
jgi:MFS family permease